MNLGGGLPPARPRRGHAKSAFAARSGWGNPARMSEKGREKGREKRQHTRALSTPQYNTTSLAMTHRTLCQLANEPGGGHGHGTGAGTAPRRFGLDLTLQRARGERKLREFGGLGGGVQGIEPGGDLGDLTDLPLYQRLALRPALRLWNGKAEGRGGEGMTDVDVGEETTQSDLGRRWQTGRDVVVGVGWVCQVGGRAGGAVGRRTFELPDGMVARARECSG